MDGSEKPSSDDEPTDDEELLEDEEDDPVQVAEGLLQKATDVGRGGDRAQALALADEALSRLAS